MFENGFINVDFIFFCIFETAVFLDIWNKPNRRKILADPQAKEIMQTCDKSARANQESSAKMLVLQFRVIWSSDNYAMRRKDILENNFKMKINNEKLRKER